MVIKVLKDQPIPADGLILGTPSADVVFVSTKNLDG
jgi:magnesium-transporting ATPase (P-type)